MDFGASEVESLFLGQARAVLRRVQMLRLGSLGNMGFVGCFAGLDSGWGGRFEVSREVLLWGCLWMILLVGRAI